MKGQSDRLKINLGLLFAGLIVVISGLLIQIKFHMGNHGMMDLNRVFWKLNKTEWSLFHKIAVIVFTFFVAYHIQLNRKWFKAVITKKLMAKNKATVTLSIVFLLVALTGYLSWFIQAVHDAPLNNTLIEIHDRIGLILIILFIIHIHNRLKWFISAYKKWKA